MPRVKGIKKNVKKVYNEEQAELLLHSLQLFFVNNKDYIDLIYDIVQNNNQRVKLAMIDYFTTIYSKKRKCCIEIEGEDQYDIDYFYINDEYKNQLKSFTKRLFDPFKRFKKITFKYDDIDMVTTVGQLNFLKWAIKNKVIQFIEDNFVDINKEMSKHLEDKRTRQEAKKVAKLATQEVKEIQLKISNLVISSI